MAKYIDADILQQKLIERLGLFEKLSSDTISPIRIDECKKIISIIDSLHQEQPEYLDEAAGEYLDNHKPLTRYNWGDLMDAFHAGAEWQKAQMMKGAVEKTVGQLERQWGGNIHFMHGFEVDEMDFPFLNSQECGYGDKVRIIIVKEDK